ncbi:Zinc metalloproteinase nas-4 [Geodia barretti]|uniref:Metalloendopeptidase n=1 Tax=Geodia barretti TaxID=519541 RepID=A0AA35XIS6_GEOBA|nr:Zinc metalloproteinase nas-4 [Geodia barretti]
MQQKGLLYFTVAILICFSVDALPTEISKRVVDEDNAIIKRDATDGMRKHQATSNQHTGKGLEPVPETMEYFFEGDIESPLSNILKHYNLSANEIKELVHEQGGHLVKGQLVDEQDVRNEEGYRWENNVVPYKISDSFTLKQRKGILRAIDNWSDSTCLRFVEQSTEEDYIHFIKDNGCSSYVGRTGDRQRIRLTASCIRGFGSILHEIGHSLGLWHEQSRPDRDSYVTVHLENILERKDFNFDKQIAKVIDFQGSKYDYGSIMHYPSTAFDKPGCKGVACTTIEVNNDAEYEKQGRPKLGQRVKLSPSDITQINRLYNCPAPGREGYLLFHIRDGKNLEDGDNPYVEIKAVDSTGHEYVQNTLFKKETKNPTWNEWLHFSNREWQFFRISVWEHSTTSANEPTTMSVTVPLLENPRNSINRKYCGNIPCNQYVMYDYMLLNPTHGTLRVKVRSAKNLPDTDGRSNLPDPYVKIEARKPDDTTVPMKTNSIKGTVNPTWDDWLDMGGCSFVAFSVQVWDKDLSNDDKMSELEFIAVFAGYHSVKHCVTSSCDSYLLLDYELNEDETECSPNPCHNGGTCIEGCASFTCSCHHSYTGDECQYWQGRLVIMVRNGKNLPDEDWHSNSDPYLRIVAHDQYGKSLPMKTKTDWNDENPEWDQSIDFGVGTWTRFTVRVWDKDKIWGDDPLSKTQTWYLEPGRASSDTNVRLNAYEGYIVFDYTYT